MSTGLIGDGIGLYFASSFMAVSFLSLRGLESRICGFRRRRLILGFFGFVTGNGRYDCLCAV